MVVSLWVLQQKKLNFLGAPAKGLQEVVGVALLSLVCIDIVDPMSQVLDLSLGFRVLQPVLDTFSSEAVLPTPVRA